MLSRVLVGLVLAVALSGCTTDEGEGASATLRSAEVSPNDSSARHVPCGTSAELLLDSTAGAEGSYTISIKSGGGVLVFQEQYDATAQSTVEPLSGLDGTWEMRIHKSLEYDGTFTATLTCL